MLFFLKNTSTFKNVLDSALGQGGLTYNNVAIGDLVNKDTDLDGIPDWEEALWGTDPTKKETTPGIPDSVAIEKLKAAQQQEPSGETATANNQEPENITKTDQFSRDLLATITSLNQNGAMDQTTADQISSSLADSIQNSPQRKVYTLSDLKIIKNDTSDTVIKYNDTFSGIFKKNPTKYTILDVLQKFGGDGNNVDVSALSLLDPNIKQINGFIEGMIKLEVPQSLASLHLGVINGFQKIVENLNDIKLYETDTIVSLGGIIKYETNSNSVVSAVTELVNAIDKKLSP